MTSHLGSSMGDQSTPEIALEAVRNHFRPEFLNRIDEIVIFQSLTKSSVQRILELQLGDLANRLAMQKVEISFDANAKEHLLDEGYDLSFGARPLKRTVQRLVEDRIALAMVKGEIHNGTSVCVTLDSEGDLNFEVTKDTNG